MTPPISTYRIQFHQGFRLSDLEQVMDYIRALGISTVYASPVFTATPGSTHGYDALDAGSINPEVGTLEELKELSRKLRAEGIGWLQDIVPNHMAFDPRNPWLRDVLEKGQQSRYAYHFDIAWQRAPLMVPFLGAPLEEVVRNGELKLAFDGVRLVLQYFDAAYPLSVYSYATVLKGEGQSEALEQLLQQWEEMRGTEDKYQFSERWHEWLQQFEGLMKNEKVGREVAALLEQFNSDGQKLLSLAGEGVYRLCHWQETDGNINYRRFFTVNGLICLNIQDPQVMDEHHALVRSLVKEGVITGLRIDHIDGLYDPVAYLERLKEMMGKDTYIVVEKILEHGEDIPAQWPIEGNTGYDFLSDVNNLLTQKGSEEAFTQFYYSLVADHRSVPQQVRDKKAAILYHHMGGELENLYDLFMGSGLVKEEDWSQMRVEDIKTAIAEILIHCPVYRFYGNALPLDAGEKAAFESVVAAAKGSRPDLSPALDLVSAVILQRSEGAGDEVRGATLHFYKRLMQFSGPLMAKGVEDTLMYTFHRFIGHNEVGDAPDAFGMTVKEFHRVMKKRQRRWPLSLNATATHDTKRGEDVRARLNVLTQLPSEWLRAVGEWQKLNEGLKKGGAPDVNDEYFIYQTLVGTYPFAEENDYGERLGAYLQKALREAKRHSNWTTPNEAYEKATTDFALALLDKNKPFWKSFSSLHQTIKDGGVLHSLVQTVLKYTCPGVPDLYQGCELWDLSFVDPDNRRPVDYAFRQQLLEEMQQGVDFSLLWEERASGKIKLWIIQQLLQLRKSESLLFAKGEYIPLAVEGKYRNHVVAFARKFRRKWLLVVLPLHTVQLAKKSGKDITALDWEDTRVMLPHGASQVEWLSVLEGERGRHEHSLELKGLFANTPFALLKGESSGGERGAGLLLHLTSLPSPFGIGDMGPEAYHFADQLAVAGQKYWQLLPLNPTEGGQGHSPYSAVSSFAGNPLLISPEGLVKGGLLTAEEINEVRLPQEGKTLYSEAEKVKKELLSKAFARYKEGAAPALQAAFEVFAREEESWLPDFSLYLLLKQKNGGKPWYEWEEGLKRREDKALQQLVDKEKEALEQISWTQFLFYQQWKALKQYCNDRGIGLIGDLPIYVSYDSADVWASQEIFALDEKGERMGMAGVPPDAFSADGQLWGMPVYRWDALEQRGFDWWIARLKKNRALFDLIRLDHFRAFADYWEVPAGAQTAREGSWKRGPGAAFFEAVQGAMGELPFIAEDLGEINKPVTDLRDQFRLPGMKVLLFAFDESMASSDYIPHNYTQNFVVYTGTHDNNTVRGWWRDEADEETRWRVQQYLGRTLTEDEVPDLLCRMAFASVANTVIIPVQDLLGLDGIARMNVPASGENNWAWRLLPGQLTEEAWAKLGVWTGMYNREA